MGKGQKPSWTFIFGIVIQLFFASVLATSQVAFRKDGVDPNYASLLKECKKIKLPNGTMIQTVPKLLQTPFVTARSNWKSKYGPPITQAVCKFPDCHSNPCQHGSCEETLQGYKCLCFPGFRGEHCAEKNMTTLASPYQVNNKTGITNCSSNPCHNGGLCTETSQGYQCNCTTDFYGHTCSCPIIHTPDVGDTRQYTFPGLQVAPGMTSFDFEVSADRDVYIGLSRSDAQEDFMYEISIGGWDNTSGGIRRCVYKWGSPCDFKTLHKPDPAVTLSGLPSYDHYQISFADGNITLHRYDSQELLMEFRDPNPLEVNYVGIWTGYGSEGYWKFPSFCS